MDDFHNSTGTVLVIGSAGTDVIGFTPQETKSGVSNPAQIRISFGGVSRNIADNLSRLGLDVHLITAVGKDDIGDSLIHHAESCGIHTESCIQSDKHATGSYIGILNNARDLQFAMDDMRVLSAVNSSHLLKNKELFKKADMVFLDMNLAPQTIKTIFNQAKIAKIPVVADTTSSSLAQRLLPYMSQVYMLTANAKEASALCENPVDIKDSDSAITAARCFINSGVDIALITLAEFGVSYATAETTGHISAVKTSILDPTGGGDSLTAAVIFGLLNDISLDESIMLGITAASMTLQYPGTVHPGLNIDTLYSKLII